VEDWCGGFKGVRAGGEGKNISSWLRKGMRTFGKGRN